MAAKMRYGKYLGKINRPLPHKGAVSMGKSNFPESCRQMSAALPKGFQKHCFLHAIL